MIVIPPLKPYTQLRPGRPRFEEPCLIPDEQHGDIWKRVYRELRALKFRSPVVQKVQKYINPHFGFFGFRVHPVTQVLRYFHTGVFLDLKHNRKIYPVRSGLLEYAGYGAINGHYVLLSHPDIVTEDGYVFHTMYCHLKKPLVKFNSYQKMLREISLGSYPLVEIEKGTVLGTAASSGLSREHHPGVYIQFSFRRYNEIPIIINPLLCYQANNRVNTTEHIDSEKELEQIKELLEEK